MNRSGAFSRVMYLWIALLWVIGFNQGRAGIYSGELGGPSEGVKATLACPFDVFPVEGTIPFKLTIENNTNSDGTFTLTINGGGASQNSINWSEHFSVRTHSKGEFWVCFPMENRSNGYSVSNYHTFLSGNLLGGEFSPSSFSVDRRDNSTQTPMTLCSTEASKKVNWVEVGSKRTPAYGGAPAIINSTVAVADLPDVWKAYLGIGTVMITQSEWLALKEEQRDAILKYVSIGGRLRLFVDDSTLTDSSPLRFPSDLKPTGELVDSMWGLGQVSLQAMSTLGKSDVISDLVVTKAKPMDSTDLSSYTSASWTCGDHVGDVYVSPVLVLVIVVVFMALVGPINLFYFAPAKRRIRMFWTTPLISLAASTLLFLGILLSDGVGGKGSLSVLLVSLPSLHQEVLLQEQASKMALLFSTDWKNENDEVVEMIDRSDYRMGNSGSGSLFSSVLGIDGTRMYGNWFRSRAVTWQYIQNVRSSRECLLLQNWDGAAKGEPPILISQYPVTLKEVRVNIAGKYWKAHNLDPGVQVTAEAGTKGDWEGFRDNLEESVGPLLKRSLGRVPSDSAGYFMASSDAGNGVYEKTLSSIHWNVEQVAYMGALAQGDDHGR